MKWERFVREMPDWEEAKKKDKLELEQVRMFKEVVEPIFDSLVGEMKPHIEAGRWGVILGDDRGGRLPALAMREILARATKEGDGPPDTFFVAAGKSRKGEEYEENLRQRIADLKELIGDKRVLVVTDHIDRGETVRRLAELLKENGIDFDVMSLSKRRSGILHGSGEFEETVDLEQILPKDSKVFIGNENRDEGIIFWTRMRPYMTIDQLNRNDSGLVADDDQAISIKDPKADQTFISSARELNKEMADRVYEKYFKNGTNN